MLWIFGTGVIAIAIAGYVISKDLTNGFSLFTCAVVSIVDEILNGNAKGTWVGLNPAINIVNTLPSNLKGSMDDLLSAF